MDLEEQAVIDVEVAQVDSTELESIAIEHWYSAVQVQSIANLNKSGLQKAIAKLHDIYGIELKVLRRGEARATQYSEFALKACKLLNAGKLSELRKLLENAPIAESPASSTAIVFVEQHNQIATNAATIADSNLAEISVLKSGLLNNYRELGRALGKQAAAEVQLGFTEEVAIGIKKLQES